MGKRFDVVFFDVGFTLIYYHPSLPELLLRAFREAGMEVSAEELQEAQAHVAAEMNRNSATRVFEATKEADAVRETELRRRILAELGVQDEETLRRLCEREEAIFAEPGAIRLYPEVRQVLSRLHKEGYRLGIISNWSWNLVHRCDQVGITEDFELILASAYAGCLKPNPCIFRQALDGMNVAAERAIHVGDDYEADVLGARSAGLEAVLVERDQASRAWDCPVISNLQELFPILETS